MLCLFGFILACAVGNEVDSSSIRNVNGISVASSVSDEQVSSLPQATVERLKEIDAVYFYLDPGIGAMKAPIISTSDFAITITVSKLYTAEKLKDGLNTTEDAYEFMAVGHWYLNPLFEYADCFAINSEIPLQLQ